MENLVWLGIRESEVKYSSFINNSISIFGSNSNSLQNQIKKTINHNNQKYYNFIADFYIKEIINKIEKNPNIKFMNYSQIYNYDSINKLGLLDYVICLNDPKLIKFINNKFKIKEYLKKYIPVLDYIFIRGRKYELEKLKQIFKTYEFVIQSEESSGGFRTLLLNENNKDTIRLNSNEIYMVTKYCKNNIAVNIHVLVSKTEITLLEPSIQNIEVSENRLMYKGSDFIAYKEIVDNKIDSKLKKYATIVGKMLQNKGYRGILGIDSIIYNGEVYFMEINPRFQNSSTIINKALKDNNLPSLQELQYNCFYNKSINLKPCDVNYSSYVNEYGTTNNKIKIEPIEILDKFNEDIEYEDFSYLSTYIYDKPIMKITNNYHIKEK